MVGLKYRHYLEKVCFLLICISPVGHLKAKTKVAPSPEFLSKSEQSQQAVRLKDYHSSDVMKVKIFPHARSYKPHGRDRVTDRVKLVSPKKCEVFEAQSGRIGPYTPRSFLYSAAEIELSVASLHAPVWVVCSQPFVLHREKDLPHFRYGGALYAHSILSEKGRWELELINVVNLEEYVKGVVPSEVYADWKMETLKTQAIAARTYAVYHRKQASAQRRKGLRLWDVDDTIQYQAYTGLSLRTSRTNQAVERTAGVVITHRGEVIQAYYHADSGGQTETASQVWSQDIPYTLHQREWFVGDEEHAPSQWVRRMRAGQLLKRLQRAGFGQDKKKILRFVVPVAGRTNSGRVRYVLCQFSDQSNQMVPIDDFKKAFGGLPSTLFSFEHGGEVSYGYVKIQGKGRGHGVGLSQKGAEFLAAKHGWSFDDILSYYYINTNLCRLSKNKTNAHHPKLLSLPVCS